MRGDFEVRDVDESPAGHAWRTACNIVWHAALACRAAMGLGHEECLCCGYLMTTI
jgi:hypothetical protein